MASSYSMCVHFKLAEVNICTFQCYQTYSEWPKGFKICCKTTRGQSYGINDWFLSMLGTINVLFPHLEVVYIKSLKMSTAIWITSKFDHCRSMTNNLNQITLWHLVPHLFGRVRYPMTIVPNTHKYTAHFILPRTHPTRVYCNQAKSVGNMLLVSEVLLIYVQET